MPLSQPGEKETKMPRSSRASQPRNKPQSLDRYLKIGILFVFGKEKDIKKRKVGAGL
jgi:hypothetical protein